MGKEGFVKVRRGLTEHLAVLTGNEVKVFLALLLTADYNNGTARISVTDLCGMVGVAKSCVLPAIRELVDGEYITYKPAANQYGLSEFTIVKYDGAGTTAGTTAGTCAGSESDLAPIPAQAPDLPKQPLKNLRNKKKDIEEEHAHEFEEFWKVYPRKDGKKKALEFFAKVLSGKSGVTAAFLTEKAAAYAKTDRTGHNGKDYTLYASTWLNQERFNDESLATKAAEPDEVDRYTGWF